MNFQTATRMFNVFSVVLALCFSTGILCDLVSGPEDIYVFHGESGTLTCKVEAGNTVIWSDITFGATIFAGEVGSNEIKRGDSAGEGTKYENFDYFSPSGSVQFDLVINDAVLNEDEGVYRCQETLSTSRDGEVFIEVKPQQKSISCQSSVECPSKDSSILSEVTCVCTANGAFPESLEFQWINATGSNTERTESSSGLSGTFDFTSSATAVIDKDNPTVSCNLTGYNSEVNENEMISTYQFSPPSCMLDIECSEAVITCNCVDASPEDIKYTFYDKDQNILDGDQPTSNQMRVDIEHGEDNTFYCWGCNGIYFGEHSFVNSTVLCHSTSTFHSMTSDDKIGGDCHKSSSPGLIAICCIEGVIIIAMIFVTGFVYSIKKGWRKKDAPNLPMQFPDTTDNSNSAYMDLQDTKISSPQNVNADVPYENLKLREPLPGKGLVIYQRAQMITTSKSEEIVVKTVSDDSPVRLEKLQADEVRMLSALASNVNVVQFFGCCHRVPSLLCFEFVSGNNLVKYLEENFQRSKIHQYGNTKQKRFHVAEKGSVEILPRFALQIARGMKFLTTHKFLHPGLRSEKVIIDVSGQCKLYDFVSKEKAKEIIAILWGKSVPYQWMPPEYLFLEKLDPAVDVWSFGVVLWEIFSYGAKPYEGKSRSDVEKRLREKEYLEMPNNCPGAIWQIVLNCWEQSPGKRPSFDHLNLQLAHMCSDNKEYDEIHST